jgi:membrane protease YdiL (CAAX protease family)
MLWGPIQPEVNPLIEMYISRIVAFVLTPILMPVAAIVANWLQDAVGINLSGGDLTAYLIAVIAGVGIVAWQWLRNRIKWETLESEVKRLHDLGGNPPISVK